MINYSQLLQNRFYLNCVNRCLFEFQPNVKWDRIIDFMAHQELDESEKQLVVILCSILAPQNIIGTSLTKSQFYLLLTSFSDTIFLGNIFFSLPDGHPAFKGSPNRFYDIDEAESVLVTGVAAGKAFQVESRTVTVTQFMVFTDIWLRQH